MNFIGIDPGKKGGIAWIDGPLADSCAPLKKYSSFDIYALFARLAPGVAYLERVWPRPGEQSRGAFTFGQGYGQLLACLEISGLSYVEVLPNWWQKEMDCQTGGDKNVSKAKAMKLFPDLKITHYNADALLLAECCRRRCGEPP